jgi:alkanesulfonate monooxygenase SsuD/methylene tetrahydromethanopterin reductase-like flavin-dependent oxidoreductase (luciferase family)
VGRLGDGWLASQVTPTEVERGCRVIFGTAEEHRRRVDEDHIGVVLGFHVAASLEQAAPAAERYITRARPDAGFEAFSALGPPAAVADRIREYVAAGASKFVVRPLCRADQMAQQLELFGREVLPAFHR